MKVTAEALFGLVEEDVINETIGPFHHDVVFRDCEGDFLALGGQVDQFRAPDPGIIDDGEKAAIALGLTDEITGDVASAFSNVLTGIGSQIFCLFGTSDSKDVNSGHPAPRYGTSRGVEDGPGPNGDNSSGTPPPVSDPAAERQDVTIAANTVRCGAIEAKKLTVNAGVTVTVGDQDLDNDGQVTGSPAGFVDLQDRDPVTGASCDGRLNIDAEEVVVNGTITATGARDVTAGPGAGGSGGGGGHAGAGGGRGGFGEPGGGAAYAAPAGGPFEDVGSAGGNGFVSGVAGGRGGGTIRIASAGDIDLGSSGQILARGGPGANAGGACDATGGGGGSGGAIEVSGSRVVGTGSALISVSGGSGGSGPRGGGGGSAGRLTANRVVDSAEPLLRHARQQAARAARTATAPAASTTAATASARRPATSSRSARTSTARPSSTSTSPRTPARSSRATAKLLVKGVQDPQPAGEGHMDIVVCRKYLDPEDTVAPFEDPALDPGDDTLAERLDNDRCFVVGVRRPERRQRPLRADRHGAAERPDRLRGRRLLRLVRDRGQAAGGPRRRQVRRRRLLPGRRSLLHAGVRLPEPRGVGRDEQRVAAGGGVRADRLGHRRADVRHAVDEPRAQRLRRLPGQLAVPPRAEGAPEGRGERRHVGRRHRDVHGVEQRPRRRRTARPPLRSSSTSAAATA